MTIPRRSRPWSCSIEASRRHDDRLFLNLRRVFLRGLERTSRRTISYMYRASDRIEPNNTASICAGPALKIQYHHWLSYEYTNFASSMSVTYLLPCRVAESAAM